MTKLPGPHRPEDSAISHTQLTPAPFGFIRRIAKRSFAKGQWRSGRLRRESKADSTFADDAGVSIMFKLRCRILVDEIRN